MKVEREQIEQLARLLRVERRLSDSGAALFRRCLDRVSELDAQGMLDRLDRTTGRARLVMAFGTALGGGDGEETEASARDGAGAAAG